MNPGVSPEIKAGAKKNFEEADAASQQIFKGNAR